MSDSNPNPVIKGRVTVAQHHLPGLEAGEYQMTVKQEVAAVSKTGGKPAQETFESRAVFAVRGERFRLPPADLHSVFPPENTEGEFSHVLPHAVFCRRTLPWERSPSEEDLRLNPQDDIPSWVALLLFDETDTAAFPAFDLKPKAATIASFFPGAGLGKGISYFNDVPAGHTAADLLEPGECVDEPCLILDVPLELFRAVAPSLEDLKLLAHSRTVSMENQEQSLGDLSATQKDTLADLTPEDDFSVVFCNRLPAPGHRAAVHMVSLEGLADHLPGSALSAQPTQDGQFLRLAVLKSWSFAAANEGEKNMFVETLKGLNADNGPNTLRLPIKQTSAEDSAARTVSKALSLGYTALDHELRGGGRTVSWYRGPLLPSPKTGRVLEGPITSPDAAYRYDPDTGLLDVSYAAAWQIGRLMALQDKAFSTALYAWKRKNENALAARIAERISQGFFDSLRGPAENAAPPMQGVMDLLAKTLDPTEPP